MSSSMFNFKSSGVKTINRKFSVEKTKERPIGIKTPLEEGDDLFKMNTDPIKQLADNFRNLIMTNHGERLGRYNYGANLNSLIFEYSNNPKFEEIIEGRIVDETQKEMPEIQILSVDPLIVDQTEKNDLNRLGLTKVRLQIQYVIPKFQSPRLGLEVDLVVGG